MERSGTVETFVRILLNRIHSCFLRMSDGYDYLV